MSKILKNILIGTTLTEGSDEIVGVALALARATGARPHLVHVLLPPPAYTGLPAEYRTGADDSWFQACKQDLEDKLTAQARRTGLLEKGVDGKLYFEAGVPHRILETLASTLRADLVVVGASERSRHRLGLGSTADRVIRKVPCPVLTVRPGVPFPPKSVLVPVDFSAGSAGALRYAVTFLAEAKGALPPTEAVFVTSPGESTIHFSPEQITRFAESELHRFITTNVPNAAVKTRVLSGYPSEQILAEVEARHPDLVILATREKSGLERLLIGSVASSVLREAPCNVLVVPPEAAYREVQEVEAQVQNAGDWAFVSDEQPEPVGVK